MWQIRIGTSKTFLVCMTRHKKCKKNYSEAGNRFQASLLTTKHVCAIRRHFWRVWKRGFNITFVVSCIRANLFAA